MTGWRRHLATSSLWAVGGFTTLAAGSLVVNAILTRALSPELVGVYFLAVSVVASAAAVGRVGLNQAVVRLVTQAEALGKRPAAEAALRTVIRVAAMAATTSGLLLTFAALPPLADHAFEAPVLADLAVLLGCWCVIESLRLVTAEALRGFGRVGAATLLGDAGRQVVFGVAVIATWLLHDGLTLDTVIASALVAGLAVLGASLFLLRGALRQATHAQPAPTATSVLRLSMPMMVTAVSLLAVRQGDLWLAGAFLPAAEVGIYGATARLVILVVVPLHICNVALSPVIARLYAQGKLAELERSVRAGATAAVLPTVVAVAALLSLGGPILGAVYGDPYRDGALVLGILAAGQLVNALVGACGQALLMTGHHRLMMTVTAIGGVAFLGTGGLATWWFGAPGLAAASAATTAGTNVVLWVLVRRRLGIRTEATVSRRLLVGP